MQGGQTIFFISFFAIFSKLKVELTLMPYILVVATESEAIDTISY